MCVFSLFFLTNAHTIFDYITYLSYDMKIKVFETTRHAVLGYTWDLLEHSHPLGFHQIPCRHIEISFPIFWIIKLVLLCSCMKSSHICNCFILMCTLFTMYMLRSLINKKTV